MKKVQYVILIFLIVLAVSCNGNNNTVLPVQRNSSSESDLTSDQSATLEPAKMKITAVGIENLRYLNGNVIHIYMLDLDNDGSDEISISQWAGGTAGIVGFAV